MAFIKRGDPKEGKILKVIVTEETEQVEAEELFEIVKKLPLPVKPTQSKKLEN